MNEKVASKKLLSGRVNNGALDWRDVQILGKRVKTNSKIKQQQQQQQQQQKLITSKTSCPF